jgi:hypothetical protein
MFVHDLFGFPLTPPSPRGERGRVRGANLKEFNAFVLIMSNFNANHQNIYNDLILLGFLVKSTVQKRAG